MTNGDQTTRGQHGAPRGYVPGPEERAEVLEALQGAGLVPGPPRGLLSPAEYRRVARRAKNGWASEGDLLLLREHAVAKAEAQALGTGRLEPADAAERKREGRRRLLQRVAPDRRCWHCGELKVGTRQLLVFKRTDVMDYPDLAKRCVRTTEYCCAVCVGCHRKYYPLARQREQVRDVDWRLRDGARGPRRD
jgi:hypothetical protein